MEASRGHRHGITESEAPGVITPLPTCLLRVPLRRTLSFSCAINVAGGRHESVSKVRHPACSARNACFGAGGTWPIVVRARHGPAGSWDVAAARTAQGESVAEKRGRRICVSITPFGANHRELAPCWALICCGLDEGGFRSGDKTCPANRRLPILSRLFYALLRSVSMLFRRHARAFPKPATPSS